MNTQRRKSIRKRVEALLSEHSVTTAPVPVERIAKRLGARLRFQPLDDELSGMIYVKDGLPIIGVNSLHHPNRQRFTIAHECGHLLLHRDQISKEVHVDKGFPMSALMRDTVSSTGEEEIEVQANFFAAELLMPVPFLVEAIGEETIDIDDDGAVSSLAKTFKVSPSAMKFRIGNLLA